MTKESKTPPGIAFGEAAWMQNARRVIRTEIMDLTGFMPLVLVENHDHWWLFGEDVARVLNDGYVDFGMQYEFDVRTIGGISTVLTLPVHQVIIDEFIATVTADGYTVVKMKIGIA